MCSQLKERLEPKLRFKFLKVKPFLYATICILVMVVAYGYKLRSGGIFSCPANGYSSNTYLAYCNGDNYGDYDHGAFWFDLEPEAQDYASKAEVLFLGNSRMQFAFSSSITKQWFSSSNLNYYLLGFSHSENSIFVEPLLNKFAPKAKVYVINVDRFFYDKESIPAREIRSGKDMFHRYKVKLLWQRIHKSLCNSFPVLCGSGLALYRSRDYGNWQVKGTFNLKAIKVSDGPASEMEYWDDYTDLGKQFISQLPVPTECVILTIVPYENTKRAEAQAIARSLGLDLVAPKIDSLITFDRSHLNAESAEIWASAFLDIAGPKIHRCLENDNILSVGESS